ncbi:MAG: HEAT repeat domain-containing protein, partial [Vicinamibacteria bacterium]
MRHSLRLGICSGVVVLAAATVLAIGTIKELSLDDGHDDVNKLIAPAVDGSRTAVAIGTIAGTFDKSAKIVRRGATGFMTRGPEYNLDKALDLGALFGSALKQEATAMGFGASGASAWQVDATIKDIYVESKQIPYGATLFYGFMDVDFRVAQGGAAPQTVSMRLHNYNGGYNAGMGRKDEAMVALAHLLVEGAQEALARLNRLHFKAPPHPGVAALLEQVKTMGANRPAAAVHRVALSGSPEAPAALLALVPKEPDENRRSSLIEALARLGAPEAVPVLSQRYAAEDEDCRWVTLKAMDYIGGADAEALLKSAGLADKDGGPRRLAEKATGAKNK